MGAPLPTLCRYTAALQLDAGMVPALNNRALALLKLGLHAQAEADCTTVRAGPRSPYI